MKLEPESPKSDFNAVLSLKSNRLHSLSPPCSSGAKPLNCAKSNNQTQNPRNPRADLTPTFLAQTQTMLNILCSKKPKT
ncbi:hypothetical protein [Helicobacter felistomachi]|uniref:hypothetical protein n=1 Tax=Helicobacter felistomachi TaxID=3040201 RepID=UPI002573A380|nr:hypothetical protein [Helicobacter sp. NHP21005]